MASQRGRGVARTASVPVKLSATRNASKNAHANRMALKSLSELELATGRSDAYWAAFHATQKARVLARYGLDQQAAA